MLTWPSCLFSGPGALVVQGTSAEGAQATSASAIEKNKNKFFMFNLYFAGKTKMRDRGLEPPLCSSPPIDYICSTHSKPRSHETQLETYSRALPFRARNGRP